MVYEILVLASAEADDATLESINESVKSAISEGGEVLKYDDWGVKSLAQPTEKGMTKGRYLYFMFKSDGKVNIEIERRLRINEFVVKFLCVKLGQDKDIAQFQKSYKNPKEMEEGDNYDLNKEKKMFSKKKSCWFSAKKTSPDWKYPSSYAWLVNEFGKISAARVTGLRPRFQRMATSSIKRGRNMGLISHLSNQTFR